MVWLSVIVMGFLLLGRLAPTLLARCFEGGGPPCQLIEHLPGGEQAQFWWILAIMLAMSAGMLYYFRRKRWM